MSAQQIEVEKIWDRGPHNAFTDLIRFDGSWYCSFREATGHSVWDGHILIIRSAEIEPRSASHWSAIAHIACPQSHNDLRDPKLSITPDGHLMLTAAAYKPVCQSFSWFSNNGVDWGEGNAIGPAGLWLWRTVWHKSVAYNFGRSEIDGDPFLQLFASDDGIDFRPHGARQFDGIYVNESAPIFLEDNSCMVLLRRDSESATAQLGFAEPPYENWRWRDLGVRVGGPTMTQLPDGRFVAVVRLYDGSQRTSLCWIDPSEGTLREFLTLPSGGDTSYAGLLSHDGLLWISYYSSDDAVSPGGSPDKTSIYLTSVRLDSLLAGHPVSDDATL